MTSASHEPGGLPPDVHLAIVAGAVLVRAEIAERREERQANLDRLAGMWQPTLADIENADELKSLAIHNYTIARIQNVEDLTLLDEALELTGRAIGLLEGPASGLTMVLSFSLERIGYRLAELTELDELKESLEELREIVEGAEGPESSEGN